MALLTEMLFLAVALSLDVFVVAAIIWHERAVALAAAVGTALLCALVWEGYPSLYRLRRRSRS